MWLTKRNKKLVTILVTTMIVIITMNITLTNKIHMLLVRTIVMKLLTRIKLMHSEAVRHHQIVDSQFHVRMQIRLPSHVQGVPSIHHTYKNAN